MSRDWGKISLEMHKKYRGKIEVVPKVPVKGSEDLSIWYTPGVAEPAKVIAGSGSDLSFDLTWRWNAVAVISDGSRVLGLGDIGPEAALPVMEGKALLFKYFGGVDAIPLVVREKDVEKFIRIVKALEPSFGGINLEDISSPKCFEILDRLRNELEIPVWHDDQQGTALIVLAALINAFKVVGKDLKSSRIVLLGLGAANYSVLRFLEIYGVDLGHVIVVERPGIGILHSSHPMLNEFKKDHPHWYYAALHTNSERITGDPENAFKGADAVIAASKPGPGTLKEEWIKLMNDKAIVFALANPIPEISPEKALKAGAKVVATGRPDYPNQVNNSLGFPAMFRGALTVRARKITNGMCMAAAEALAKYAENRGLSEQYVIPRMEEIDALRAEAVAVAVQAIEEGVARKRLSRDEVEKEIFELIERPRKEVRALATSGIIQELK